MKIVITCSDNASVEEIIAFIRKTERENKWANLVEAIPTEIKTEENA